MSYPTPVEPSAGGRVREIVAILVMAFAVLTLVSLHSSASGAVGVALSRLLRAAFGQGADVPALLLFWAGFSVLRSREREGRVRRAAAVLLAFIVGLSAYHTVVTYLQAPLSPYWAQQVGEQGAGGGAVGAYVSARMLAAFGPWGSPVVSLALFAIAFILYTETSVTRIALSLARAVSLFIVGILRASGEFIVGAGREFVELVGAIRDRRRRAAASEKARAALGADGRQPRRSLWGRLFFPFRRKAAAGRSGDGGSNERPRRRRAGRAEAPQGPRGLAALLEEEAARAQAAASQPAAARAAEWEREAQVAERGGPEAAWEAEEGAELEPPARERSDEPASGQSDAPRRAAGARRAGGEAQPPEGERGDGIPLASPPEEVVYTLPPTALLQRPKDAGRAKKGAGEDQSQLLEETLANFGVQAKVVRVSRGPVITRYELQPAPGVKVSKIVNLADDVALNLAAADVRIEAPVPGKSVVGIEVPNKETATVYLREVLESSEFRDAPSKLSIGLGKDIAGNPVVADLTKLLHVLIAGSTGSGKSVCINTIICSILYKAFPHEVKLLMVDPKRVELAVYDGIPHLITPVVTDPKLAANALRWAVKEMESRYKKFSEVGVRNITGYNQKVAGGQVEDRAMPYLVVIIDELADLMLVAANEVEDSICRLAQMARAAGIHLVIATQRPSVDVITGLIKANVPSRIAFAVSSGVDSRTILDMMGAERLIGRGDMLYYPIGANKPLRVQGALITDQDVQETVAFWKNQGEPVYVESVTELPKSQGGVDEDEDELYHDAVQLVVETGNASISMLQRRFRIGYARAARLIDMMEMQGIVGPYQGSKPREVLRTIDEIEKVAN